MARRKNNMPNNGMSRIQKLFASKPVKYTATSSKLRKKDPNPQVKQMKKTLDANRKNNKHSSGRGVGY